MEGGRKDIQITDKAMQTPKEKMSCYDDYS